jgi:hypothetical protein
LGAGATSKSRIGWSDILRSSSACARPTVKTARCPAHARVQGRSYQLRPSGATG